KVVAVKIEDTERLHILGAGGNVRRLPQATPRVAETRERLIELAGDGRGSRAKRTEHSCNACCSREDVLDGMRAVLKVEVGTAEDRFAVSPAANHAVALRVVEILLQRPAFAN